MKAKHLLNLKAELMITTVSEFVARLGISKSTYQRWLRNPEQDLPREIALAASALVEGLEPYEPAEIEERQMRAFNDLSLLKRIYPPS